jgi:hypothetical protein
MRRRVLLPWACSTATLTRALPFSPIRRPPIHPPTRLLSRSIPDQLVVAHSHDGPKVHCRKEGQEVAARRQDVCSQNSSPRQHKAIKLTNHRCDFLTTFKVIVGPKSNRQKFTLHHDLMVQRSEFFRAARSKTWIRDKPTRPTNLEQEDPEVFATYVRAVYFDRIRVEGVELDEHGLFESNAALEEELATESDTTKDGVLHGLKAEDRYLKLMKLYALAKFLLDHKTANLVVDETIRTADLVKTFPGSSAVESLYRSTVDGDCMRRLVVDYYVDLANHKYFAENREYHWPRDFVEEVAMAFMEGKENGFFLDRKAIFYPAFYIANWDPSQGKHGYHCGPGTEGDDLTDSDDDDSDYEEGEAVMTDDEMVE